MIVPKSCSSITYQTKNNPTHPAECPPYQLLNPSYIRSLDRNILGNLRVKLTNPNSLIMLLHSISPPSDTRTKSYLSPYTIHTYFQMSTENLQGTSSLHNQLSSTHKRTAQAQAGLNGYKAGLNPPLLNRAAGGNPRPPSLVAPLLTSQREESQLPREETHPPAHNSLMEETQPYCDLVEGCTPRLSRVVGGITPPSPTSN